jgi:hypothetical protein
MPQLQIWLKGLLAAAIAGAANGVMTGFAAVGIDPGHFNLRAGFNNTLAIAGVSAAMSAIIGVSAYLKQSPLPDESRPFTQDDHHDPHDLHDSHDGAHNDGRNDGSNDAGHENPRDRA